MSTSHFRDIAMMANVKSGAGLFAALDQSGGSTAGALEAFGIPRDSWSGDEEMFELVHQMRVRVMTAPSFNGSRVLGTILFETTMRGQVEGTPSPAHLRSRGIAPFLKVDKGLEAEANGVQLMKPIDGLSRLLDEAQSLGIVGTKMRSVIRRCERAGIASVVEQQFKLAEQIMDAGLLPILEPEVSIEAADRGTVERYLTDEIIRHLDGLSGDRQVMLKLTLPEQPDAYASLVGHHRVARVLALSGGLSRNEACDRLARNHGVIGSFSRGLLENLDHGMSDAAFDRTLGLAIEQIFAASTVKQ